MNNINDNVVYLKSLKSNFMYYKLYAFLKQIFNKISDMQSTLS
jgi:hypothetical protein